jgi:hypothetical protein
MTSPSTITERVAEMRVRGAAEPNGEARGAFAREQAELAASVPGSITAGRLGILTQPSKEARATQLQLGLDLTSVNADGTGTLPMPATVILDATRTVRWIDVHPDYSTRTEPSQVIDALNHLGH